jgi:hypothetical protein
MRKEVTIIFMMFILYGLVGCDDSNNVIPAQETFFGQIPPGSTPIRFADEIITDDFYPHSKLIISPKGDRIYWSTFLDTVSSNLALYYSDFDGHNLSAAAPDTTLDKYGIKGFTFLSNDEILFGSLQPYDKLGGRLVRAVWTSVMTDTGWSMPQAIESTVDTNWASVGSPSINNTGDIYFAGRTEGSTAKIFHSKYVNGVYQKYEPLPAMINTGITLDPFIDYQDRFLLFAAANRPENIGIIDLYISYKDEYGTWSEPQNLGENISTQFIDRFPMITFDGNYLFFVTSHSDHFPSTHTHFYWMNVGALN